jgi:predicted small lipoprotein YifL
MPYVLIAVLVLFMAFALASCGRNGALDKPDPKPVVSSTDVPSGAGSRAAVEKRLLELAKGPAPAELSRGAMCYEMVAPPLRAEFVCSDCGEKTLYACEKYGDEQMGAVQAINSALPGCRRLLPQVKDLNVALDASAFCHTCNPESTDPKLVLVVSYPNGTTHRTPGVTEDDMRLLVELTAGSDKHVGAQDTGSALKDHLPRLQQLLGVAVPEDE